MNIWENAVVTDKGIALLSKLTAGHSLEITRAVTGTEYVNPTLLHQLRDVTNPQQPLEFRPVSYPEQGKCAVPMALTNEGLEKGYTAMQIGVYATDPDEGEILFFIAQANSGTGTIVPTAEEMPGYNAEWTFYFQYGRADDVTVLVDPSNTVSRAEMKEYISSEIVAMTYAEIDAAFGTTGDGWEDGDDSETGGDSGAGTGGVATLDHSLLYNRNIPNQHTIESITGLEDALTEAEGTELASIDIETAWNSTV